MAKIFVGNFSFSVDDEQLKEYFSGTGTVLSAKVMKEGQGGRSRGFGFVEFATDEEAEKAIKELDGSVWEGRVVKVSEDRSARRSEGDTDRSSYGGGSMEDSGASRSSAPTGYFRAQPLDLGFRRRKKLDPFDEDPLLQIDYKDPKLLSKFMSERGRILPRRMTGLSARNQRTVARAIKRAQHLSLLPSNRA
jgi:ribosomal protein S18